MVCNYGKRSNRHDDSKRVFKLYDCFAWHDEKKREKAKRRLRVAYCRLLRKTRAAKKCSPGRGLVAKIAWQLLTHRRSLAEIDALGKEHASLSETQRQVAIVLLHIRLRRVRAAVNALLSYTQQARWGTKTQDLDTTLITVSFLKPACTSDLNIAPSLKFRLASVVVKESTETHLRPIIVFYLKVFRGTLDPSFE